MGLVTLSIYIFIDVLTLLDFIIVATSGGDVLMILSVIIAIVVMLLLYTVSCGSYRTLSEEIV